MAQAHIGLSGYSYKPWQGPDRFYPPGLRLAQFLHYYATRYDTVELDGVWYRLPTEKVVADWIALTHDRFIFAPKIHRQITHYSRLKPDGYEFLGVVLDRLAPLSEAGRLGPLLVQLPPNFSRDDDAWPASWNIFHDRSVGRLSSATTPGTTRRSRGCFGASMSRGRRRTPTTSRPNAEIPPIFGTSAYAARRTARRSSGVGRAGSRRRRREEKTVTSIANTKTKDLPGSGPTGSVICSQDDGNVRGRISQRTGAIGSSREPSASRWIRKRSSRDASNTL